MGWSEVTNNCDFSTNHAGLKTMKSSTWGPHKGANLGKLEIEPERQRLVRGSMEKKIATGLRLDRHTVLATGQPWFANCSANKLKKAQSGGHKDGAV